LHHARPLRPLAAAPSWLTRYAKPSKSVPVHGPERDVMELALERTLG
jgi:hypothetical protein